MSPNREATWGHSKSGTKGIIWVKIFQPTPPYIKFEQNKLICKITEYSLTLKKKNFWEEYRTIEIYVRWNYLKSFEKASF